MTIPDNDPIVAVPMVTPFGETDQVDFDAAQRNAERWCKTANSVFIVGSQSGEEFMLSEPERVDLLRCVTEALDGDRITAGGIDAPSVVETLRQAERHAEAGAEMVRMRFPRIESEVLPYFQQVLPRCPVPVLLMHQSNPASFGIAAKPAGPPELLGEIASMDGVYGYVTDHDMRFEARVRRFVPQDKRFWICNGSMILSGTLIGCNGTTTAFSNIWPDALKQLLDHGMAGNYAAGEAVQEQIRKIDEIMLPYLATGIKTCRSLMGFEGMKPRQPSQPMADKDVRRLRVEMELAGLI